MPVHFCPRRRLTLTPSPFLSVMVKLLTSPHIDSSWHSSFPPFRPVEIMDGLRTFHLEHLHPAGIENMWCGRTGTIIVSGTIGNASVTAGGLSSTYIMTVVGSVTVDLDNKAILHVNATAGRFPAFFNIICCVVDMCCMIPTTRKWRVWDDTWLYSLAVVGLCRPIVCKIPYL
jgi:hypothetical protein